MTANSLLDEPLLRRLRRLRLSVQKLRMGSVRGERTSRQTGQGLEFAEHRPYASGDDLRRVDWNVYGRLGQMFLKLFETPGQLRVLLALDDAPTLEFGEPSKLRAACQALAAVGIIALAGADAVHWAKTGDTQTRFFRTVAAEEAMLAVLAEASRSPGNGTRAAGGAVREALSARGRDTLLVLAGDFQSKDLPLRLLAEARKRGARALAISVHAREELDPELEGLARLLPIGGQPLRVRADERLIAEYQREVGGYRKAVASAVRAAGAAFLEVEAADPVEPVLRELTRMGLLPAGR